MLLEKLILLIVCTVGHAGGGVLVLKMRRVLGMCQVSESCVKRRRIEWLLKWTWTCRCYSLKKIKTVTQNTISFLFLSLSFYYYFAVTLFTKYYLLK